MSLLDVYLGSKELKRTIVERSFEFEIPLKFLCMEADINYKMFLQGYINSNTPDSTTITEKQFEKLLSLLGIEVRTQFVIQSSYKPEEVRNKLEYAYGTKNKGTKPIDTGSDNIFG